MARPHRPNVADATYHVATRAVHEHVAFVTVLDRVHFLAVLARTVARFGWIVLAYCLMGTHYHLLVRTPEPNISRGMQLLNGWYAQRFNVRHGREGHAFGRRFASKLVGDDAHLLATHRYIARNPVDAGLVAAPEEWPWSSCAATAALARVPPFLAVSEALRPFGYDRLAAERAYLAFVRGEPVLIAA